jgi:hypothetical protein
MTTEEEWVPGEEVTTAGEEEGCRPGGEEQECGAAGAVEEEAGM